MGTWAHPIVCRRVRLGNDPDPGGTLGSFGCARNYGQEEAGLCFRAHRRSSTSRGLERRKMTTWPGILARCPGSSPGARDHRPVPGIIARVTITLAGSPQVSRAYSADGDPAGNSRSPNVGSRRFKVGHQGESAWPGGKVGLSPLPGRRRRSRLPARPRPRRQHHPTDRLDPAPQPRQPRRQPRLGRRPRSPTRGLGARPVSAG